MYLRTENVEAFLYVVELGSVSGAAQRMGMSKSVVSKRLTNLEYEMDVRLINRSPRLVQPTEAGQLFYAEAREAMRCLQQAAESISQQAIGLSGELRVVAPTCLGLRWLSDLAADFAATHPRLELVFDVDDVILYADGKRYDIGIHVGRPKDTTMIARRLASSRRILCCSPQYVAAHGPVTSLEDLGSRECLSSSRASPANWSLGETQGLHVPHRAGIHRRYVTNNDESLRRAVLRGLGPAVLPLYLVADDLQAGSLVEALPGHSPRDESICAVYPRAASNSTKLKAFVQHLQKALVAPPWESAWRGTALEEMNVTARA